MATTTRIETTTLPFAREDIAQTVPQRFEIVVSHFADHIALSGKGRRWTYRQLNQRVNQIAHAIKDLTGIGKGCVAFLADQSPEMVIMTLAALKAGHAYLAVHPSMPTLAQQQIVQDAKPKLLLTTAALAQRAREIASGVAPILMLDDIDDVYSDENPPIVAQPEDMSTIFYTSGSTGRPKGVMKSHRAVLHRVWLSTHYDGITPSDRQSLLTHCSFSASESDMFGALLQGATLCVFDIASEGLSSFRTWIEEEKLTFLHPPVLLFRRFLSTLEGTNLFPSVRAVALAGEAVLPADLERWKRHFARSCVLLHRYSLTETALLTAARLSHDAVVDPSFVVAGCPVADKHLELVDEAGQAVAEGQIGEVLVRSRYIAEGYWRQPEATHTAFQADPQIPGQRIYRTGDFGRFLPDGSLVLLGRRDDLVKIRGYRADTKEIEGALMQLAGISEVAVVPHKEDDESRLWAFVVMKTGFEFDPVVLREQLRTRLPEWKIPARFQSVPALPTTPSGKVDKQLLKKAEVSETPWPVQRASKEFVPAGSMTIEEELANIWRTTLRRSDFGHDDNFLDLGGDSISAMMTLNRVQRRYGIQLTFADFFRHGTIRQLAALVGTNTAPVEIVPSSAAAIDKPNPQRPAGPLANVADGYLELLNAQGVDYIFVNPGSDIAPILESIAKLKAEGRRTPEPVLCLHESLALAAAHGYFMVSGRAQVVMVHVDVGTQNLGANLHNAQRGRAGVVICAGRAPYTVDDAIPGGRNRYNHWIQEQFNQAGTVNGYVKWQYELTCRENLRLAVQRAFQVAGAEPAGPVYLMLPREVLLQKIEGSVLDAKGDTKSLPIPSIPSADPGSLSRAAQWLIEANNPLILVGYAGRNPKAVASLVRLAETLAIPVMESRHRVNFPSRHELHLGFAPARDLQQADCVLIVDHDVPWVPVQAEPRRDCRVIHVDIDPLKRDFPIWGFRVDLPIQADSSMACEALAEEIERQLKPADRARIEARRKAVAAEHGTQESKLRQRVRDLAANKPIAPEWAASCLNEVVDQNTVIVAEAVTNSPALWSHLQIDAPGTYYQSLGSGLGWGLGAALGVKLADPSKTVICAVGDGSWMFGSPIAAYWAAEQHHSPFLTVIFNNQEYFATTKAILTTAPEGSSKKSGYYPACDLPSPPLYSKVAEALGLWAKTVEEPAELPSVLREALDAVHRGRSALVNICVSSSRPGREG